MKCHTTPNPSFNLPNEYLRYFGRTPVVNTDHNTVGTDNSNFTKWYDVGTSSPATQAILGIHAGGSGNTAGVAGAGQVGGLYIGNMEADTSKLQKFSNLIIKY